MLRCKEWNDEIAIENTSNGEVRIPLRVTPLSLTEKFRDEILCYRFATKIQEKWKVLSKFHWPGAMANTK